MIEYYVYYFSAVEWAYSTFSSWPTATEILKLENYSFRLQSCTESKGRDRAKQNAHRTTLLIESFEFTVLVVDYNYMYMY